jgi:hypothetical protein
MPMVTTAENHKAEARANGEVGSQNQWLRYAAVTEL